MSEGSREATDNRQWYTVTCYDHEGSYWHHAPGTPQKCQHCGSYNIESEEGRVE